MQNTKRTVLKGLALGSWTTPVITSVILPAHAAMTAIAQGTASAISDIDLEEDSPDGICVIFDGEVLNLVQFRCCLDEARPNTNGDCLLVLDVDRTTDDGETSCNGPVLDTLSQESPRLGDDNWAVTGPTQNGLGPGTYIFMATRTNAPGIGNQFQVAVTVSFSNIQTTNEEQDCNDNPLISRATMTANVVISAI